MSKFAVGDRIRRKPDQFCALWHKRTTAMRLDAHGVFIVGRVHNEEQLCLEGVEGADWDERKFDLFALAPAAQTPGDAVMVEFKVGDRVVRNPVEMSGAWSSVCAAVKVEPAAPLVVRGLKGIDQIDVGIGRTGWAANCFTRYFEIGGVVRRIDPGREWYAAGGGNAALFRVTRFSQVGSAWRVCVTPTVPNPTWTGNDIPWLPEKFELADPAESKVGVAVPPAPAPFSIGDCVVCRDPGEHSWLSECVKSSRGAHEIFEVRDVSVEGLLSLHGLKGVWMPSRFELATKKQPMLIEEIPVATLPEQKFSVGDFVVRRDSGDAAWVQWCRENKRQHHELFEIVDIQRDGRIGFKGTWGWHNSATFEPAIKAAPTGDPPRPLAVGDFVTNVYPHPAWLAACEKVQLAPNSVFKIDGLEQVGSSTFVAIAGMPGVFARELFKLVFTPPVTGPEQEKEEMTATNNTGAAVEPAATPSLVDTAKDQAISLGSAVTLGIKFAAVDQAGEVMLDLAKELAKDVPVLAPLLESPEGREMAKVLVALMAHSAATYAPNAIPKAGAIKTVAGLQLSVSTFKLVTPRLNELRKYLLALASIGEQFSEADLVPQALEAGDNNAVPISQGRSSTVAR